MVRERLREKDHQIGKNLKIARRARGLTQAELGQVLGVTFQQIQKYERGANRLPASRLAELVTALDVAPSELLGLSPGPDWDACVWDAVRIAQAIEQDQLRDLWLALGHVLAQ